MELYLQQGTILDRRYHITQVLGQGGFGITYKAIHEPFHRPVAIKELFIREIMTRANDGQVIISDPRYSKDQEHLISNFLLEARSLAQLEKETAIVDVIDFFQENNTAYIVMSFVDGETLSSVLKERQTIPYCEIISHMSPIINALLHVHQKGLIHRDISPDNIMVRPDGTYILMDFGSSRSFVDNDSLTRIVKEGYAPLEQLSKDGHQGPWTDIYSLCATIYEALCGKRPDSAVTRVLYDELQTPSQLGVDIDSKAEEALMKGLAVRYEDRWQNLGQLLAAFHIEETPSKPAASTDTAAFAGTAAVSQPSANTALGIGILLSGLCLLSGIAALILQIVTGYAYFIYISRSIFTVLASLTVLSQLVLLYQYRTRLYLIRTLLLPIVYGLMKTLYLFLDSFFTDSELPPDLPGGLTCLVLSCAVLYLLINMIRERKARL